MHQIDSAVEAQASSQHGRFTRAQVRAIDPDSASLLDRRLRSGRWRRLTGRVLCLPGAPADTLGTLWTAHLHVGGDSVVAHRAAAWLHGLPAIQRVVPTVVVPNGSHRRCEVATVRQSTDLLPSDVVMIDGLPLTTVARTIVDMAATASVSRIDAWLDHATAERQLKVSELTSLVDRLRRPGKAGLANIIEAMGHRLSGPGVEQGKLERELTSVVRHARIGEGIVQYPHPGRADSLELVDRAWPEAMLIVEADGRRWHDRQRDGGRDKRRDREAAAQGWQTVRYVYEDLVGSVQASADELAQIHAERIRQLVSRHPGQHTGIRLQR